MGDELEPLLDLQPLLHRIYDRARFALVIADQPLPPNHHLLSGIGFKVLRGDRHVNGYQGLPIRVKADQ